MRTFTVEMCVMTEREARNLEADASAYRALRDLIARAEEASRSGERTYQVFALRATAGAFVVGIEDVSHDCASEFTDREGADDCLANAIRDALANLPAPKKEAE